MPASATVTAGPASPYSCFAFDSIGVRPRVGWNGIGGRGGGYMFFAWNSGSSEQVVPGYR